MSHAILILMYNHTEKQLELSKKAIASILAQDIGPLTVYIVDNGSTEETWEWLSRENWRLHGPHEVQLTLNRKNVSPVKVVNELLSTIFANHDKVLAVANDVVIPHNAYRLMSEWSRGMVTALESEQIPPIIFQVACAISEDTPLPVVLVRKWLYDAMMAKDGYYLDENFTHYASDCDLALRMAACGIRGIQLDLQYYHYGSASWRLAPPGVGKKMTDEADLDRAYFKRKHGFSVDAPEYMDYATDINFRAESKGMKTTITDLCKEFWLDKGDFPVEQAPWSARFTSHDTMGYSLVYDAMFNRLRNEPIKLLEIGCCDIRFPLGSARMWREYFSHADLMCMDVVDCEEPLRRINVGFSQGDQGNRDDLTRVAAKGPFDIIIDDGSHLPDHTMLTYEILSPCLKSGGLYFIEDVSEIDIGFGHDNSILYKNGFVDQFTRVLSKAKKYKTELLFRMAL